MNPMELNEKIDRISDMPDTILEMILYRLPTKNAVATTILSSRWKNLSLFGVPPVKLDLDDSLLLNPRVNDDNNAPSVSFMDFVDKLFYQTLSDVPCVEEMTLNCNNNYGDAKVVSWVSAALRLNVRHLYLKCSLDNSETLFRSLNGCTILLTLQLSLQSELYIPDGFSLPNLKSLHLNKLIIKVEAISINELIQGCPALEYLYLLQIDLRSFDDICIRYPLLKNLVIEDCWSDATCSGLILDVPNLELLTCTDYIASHYSVLPPMSLHTVHIDVAPTQDQLAQLEESSEDEVIWHCEDVLTFVSACSSTVQLYLSSSVIESLHRSSGLCHSLWRLPVFQNLTWLSLGCLGLEWAILARLLWSAPNLQQLTLEEGFEKNKGEFARFKSLLPAPLECLELHVKKIELWVFNGDEDEFKLVEYFLKNGEVLEKLLILYPLSHDGTSLLKRLLMLPRQSKTCQIDCRRK